MTTVYKVGFIVGSLSTGSINRQLAHALARLAPPELQLDEIPIRDLPFYSAEQEAALPPSVRAYKQALGAADAVLIVTPEYNRSMPGVLKNALDWASRPRGENAFARKPTAIIGASPGALGTAIAQQHLRAVLAVLDARLMMQPEGYVQFKPGLVAADGAFTVEATAEFLRRYLAEFQAFVARNLKDRSQR
jgi:chromate reductase, NAD(P)H dehydrogenase (quinone)